MQPWWTSPLWPNRPHPKEASFADQVLQSLRIKLRDQVVTNAPDPALVEALAKRNERPHIKQEEDQNEGQKAFHPGAAKAMKLRPHSVIPSNLQRLTWQRSRKQSH